MSPNLGLDLLYEKVHFQTKCNYSFCPLNFQYAVHPLPTCVPTSIPWKHPPTTPDKYLPSSHNCGLPQYLHPTGITICAVDSHSLSRCLYKDVYVVNSVGMGDADGQKGKVHFVLKYMYSLISTYPLMGITFKSFFRC